MFYNKNNAIQLDINAMRQIIAEQKRKEIEKELEQTNQDNNDNKKKITVPLDSPFSIDFNSPQMIGLTDEMAHLFDEDNNKNVNADGSVSK